MSAATKRLFERLAKADQAELAEIASMAILHLGRAHDLISRCEKQFEMYAQNHRAKGTPEADVKAQVNEAFMRDCKKELE